MAELSTGIRYVKGIGEKRANYLEKLGIKTLHDLVSFFPRAYEDRTVIRPISMCSPGETVCIIAMVASPPQYSYIRRGMELVKIRGVDDTGSVDITFFNQPYVRNSLVYGESYVFYGKVDGTSRRLKLTNPLFEKESEIGGITGRIMPIYRLTAGISQKMLQAAVRSGLDVCGKLLPEYLPEYVRSKYQLAATDYSYENIHFPIDFSALALARRRLVFEELFVLSCALGFFRGVRTNQAGVLFTGYDPEEFYEKLPFSPTNAQRRAVEQAFEDMCSGNAMSRLIQGDVGSGKTLVAAACIWLCHKNGMQAAFMAPTEILANQHVKTLAGFLEVFGIQVGLLTGSMTAKQKRTAREDISTGMLNAVVGTHALISGDVEFYNLGLVVTDEQHRFGVEQRSELAEKGTRPHVLVMSATPIPRTLALIIYGDLDVSVIDELPPGRQTVETYVATESMRDRVNKFIRRLVAEGRQVFIVCPMVEENEELPQNLKSAQEHAEVLKTTVFPDLRIGCIHGRLKAKDKDAVMTSFVQGELDILVATTVIEVGVDVPNAALMIIENAERFGLSQLHQLRGRVGRDQHKSYCILVSDTEGDDAKTRLKAMQSTTDGFKISEEDLKLRGPGDFFGSRQHGLPEMHIADLYADMDVLKNAQNAAVELLNKDPGIDKPENQAIKERITELFELHGSKFN